MNRKGIILAGGSGSRLHPITKAVSKQLLPVYDKPMIYYPLSVLMLTGIKEVLIISTPYDLPMFERLLGDGSDLGMILKYAEQPRPDGLAQALIIAEDFLDGAPSCLILGDNLFFGNDLVNTLKAADERNEGASVFGYHVIDPERYGVVEFNKSGKVISIEEKPKHPKSNYAVPGIYFYDSHAPTYAKVQEPSARGELEITDLNQRYLEEGKLHIEILGRGTAWLDTGTHDSLSEASSFVEVVQKRQGLKIACIEEIALERGFIDENKIMTLDITKSNNSYGHYVASLRK